MKVLSIYIPFLKIVCASLLIVPTGCIPTDSESYENVDYSAEKKQLKELYSAKNNDFPFIKFELNGQYYISAALESDTLFNIYYPFFQKYRYEGNGECWTGHITQLLEKKDPTLLSHLQFDPEAGSFLVAADTKENQLRFINAVVPVFSNLDSLSKYVRVADRFRIDD